MNKQQLKTLGQCRQWHLEKYEYAQSEVNFARKPRTRFMVGYRKRQLKVSQLHKRFADAIEKCLPRPF